MPSVLRAPLGLADFIASALDFLPARSRAPYEELQKNIEAGEPIPEAQLVDAAKTVAVLTWPGRRALDHFLSTVGADEEWNAVLEAVRPMTAAVLKRIRKSTGTSTLDETLASSDATAEITEDMEVEIQAERERVRRALWEKHRSHLRALIDEAQMELEAIQKRFKALREQAARSVQEQDVIFSKLEQFEDRVYFRGETIPLETLDAELRYDIEDNEIPAVD